MSNTNRNRGFGIFLACAEALVWKAGATPGDWQQDCGHGRYEIRQRMFEFANGRHGFDNIATLEWGENGVKQVQR